MPRPTLAPARTDLVGKEIVVYGFFQGKRMPVAVVTIAEAKKTSFKTTLGRTYPLPETTYSDGPQDIETAKRYLEEKQQAALQQQQYLREKKADPHWSGANDLSNWFGSKSTDEIQGLLTLEQINQIRAILGFGN